MTSEFMLHRHLGYHPRLEKKYPRKFITVVVFNVATDRKSTRLNSSHSQISYAVFCLKKKKKKFSLDRRGSTSVPDSRFSLCNCLNPITFTQSPPSSAPKSASLKSSIHSSA